MLLKEGKSREEPRGAQDIHRAAVLRRLREAETLRGLILERRGEDGWGGEIRNSIFQLETVVDRAGESEKSAIQRELGASIGMDGGLAFSDLVTANPRSQLHDITVDPSYSAVRLRRARQIIRSVSHSIFPDQHEIDLAVGRVIAEKYNPYDPRVIRALVRAALIIPLSESRFARHRRDNLSKDERIAARRRNFKGLAFAARLAFSRRKHIQDYDVRQEAAEMVI